MQYGHDINDPPTQAARGDFVLLFSLIGFIIGPVLPESDQTGTRPGARRLLVFSLNRAVCFRYNGGLRFGRWAMSFSSSSSQADYQAGATTVCSAALEGNSI